MGNDSKNKCLDELGKEVWWRWDGSRSV